MDANIEASVDLNKFYESASKDIAAMIGGSAIEAAVIFNASPKPVTFVVYNYVDTVYLVPAQKVLVAPNKYGTVAASGKFFKIHPDGSAGQEFLVAPKTAYVYAGPGDVEQVVGRS